MPGDLLDLILIALAAAFAVAGYRQGFIVGVLSFVGFLGGAAVGAVISPPIARALVKGPAKQALVAIIVVFLAAMLGQLITSLVGSALRSRVTWRPATFVDSVGGAGVSVISVLLIAWLVGSAVVNAPFPAIAGQVSRSAVLRGVDRFMPSGAQVMFSDFRRLLASGPYTQVFGALGAEGALSVPAPSPAVLDSPGLARARPSIVKIIGTAPGCSRALEGSGFVISPQHVLTNAHVVAGVREGPTVIDGHHGSFQAQVVLYDPERDVAILYVPGLAARPLPFLGLAARGDNAIVAGYPLNSHFTAVPARIGSEEQANSPDIYQVHTVNRSIYAVRALVRPGNSGGPLLAPGGGVYGVVFAAAVDVADTGYALTASEVATDVAAGRAATSPVSTQGCD
ncbi:MAG TPA: MarP family serine protease [Streptosporangiaceae bacterium]|nr:MarP family serine protease [Streptosporangiaceae bacterium]